MEEELKKIEQDIKDEGLDNTEPESEAYRGTNQSNIVPGNGVKKKKKGNKGADELVEELEEGRKASKKEDSKPENYQKQDLRKRKKKSKSSSTTSEDSNMAVKKKKSDKKEKAARTTEGFSASDLAGEFNVAPADLRKALRDTKAKKPGASWIWASSKDEALKKIRAALKEYFKESGASSKKSKKKSKK